MSDAETQIRLASAADAPAFGRLLHAFNVELGEPTPAHCDDRGIATHVGPDLQFATAEVTKSVAEVRGCPRTVLRRRPRARRSRPRERT